MVSPGPGNPTNPEINRGNPLIPINPGPEINPGNPLIPLIPVSFAN